VKGKLINTSVDRFGDNPSSYIHGMKWPENDHDTVLESVVLFLTGGKTLAGGKVIRKVLPAPSSLRAVIAA
jgi:hypothetical protein